VTAGHLTREETAVYLRIKPSTLSLWHTQKKGPRSFLVGRRRFWAREDLDAWLAEQREGQR
jgi:hypothetical protein